MPRHAVFLLWVNLFAVAAPSPSPPPSAPAPPIRPIELGSFLNSGRCPADLTQWQCNQAANSAGLPFSFLYDVPASTNYAGHACLVLANSQGVAMGFYFNRAASSVECGTYLDCVCFTQPSPPPAPSPPSPSPPPLSPAPAPPQMAYMVYTFTVTEYFATDTFALDTTAKGARSVFYETTIRDKISTDGGTTEGNVVLATLQNSTVVSGGSSGSSTALGGASRRLQTAETCANGTYTPIEMHMTLAVPQTPEWVATMISQLAVGTPNNEDNNTVPRCADMPAETSTSVVLVSTASPSPPPPSSNSFWLWFWLVLAIVTGMVICCSCCFLFIVPLFDGGDDGDELQVLNKRRYGNTKPTSIPYLGLKLEPRG